MNAGRAETPAGDEATRDSLQLRLPLRVSPKLNRPAFVASKSNATALALVDRWPDWPGPCAAVFGPRASGKTHLLHIWAQSCGAQVLDGSKLTANVVLQMPVGMRSAIDVADAAAAREEGSTALFHLINRAQQDNGSVLMAGVTAPSQWASPLPDLRTRLAAITSAEIGAPDDNLLAGVLAKLFADQQLRASPQLISFIVARIERSMRAVDDLVVAMNAETLGTGRMLSFELADRLIAAQRRD